MKRGFEASLVCLNRGGNAWKLEATREDSDEVRDGSLSCRTCGQAFPIAKGILDALDPADDVLAREVDGWHEMAGPLGEDLVPTMTALPYYPHPPWVHLAPDFFQNFEYVDLQDRNVVDLGAGRAWSSRQLASIGRARERSWRSTS